MRKSFMLFATLSATAALAACAGNPGLSTASVNTAQAPVPTAAFDPQCTVLRARISEVEAEGTVGRVEKAADGKTRSVTIKRASLNKVAELNRLNADYRSRCSNPAIKTATATPVAAAAATPAAAATATATAVPARARTAAANVSLAAKPAQ
ncbi:MAG: hypothetical protein AAGG99_04810 [Pseudomonadota bacterium]